MADFKISFTGAAGDVVALTASLRDLKLANPGIRLQANVSLPDVLRHNPHLTNAVLPGAKEIKITDEHYRHAVHQSQFNSGKHFTTFFHEVISDLTRLRCPVTSPKPDLHLSPSERVSPISRPYWVVLAGGKTDITIKHWPHVRYQGVVDSLRPKGVRFVQTGLLRDVHKPLAGIENRLNWGGLRELFRLIAYSRGVVCPVTAAMHIAAAFDKPCVVLAGGREEATWEHYQKVPVPHKFHHSIGKLDCCLTRGCWLRRTEECPNKPANLPKCMGDISIDAVVSSVLDYEDMYSRGLIQETGNVV